MSVPGLSEPQRPLELAIVAAAEQLFAEKGYAATSIEDIAREVKLHKSTIFYYIDSKQDLLAMVLDAGLRQYFEELVRIVALPESYALRLERAIENHLRFVFERPNALKVFLRERRSLTGAKADEYIIMSRNYEQLVQSLIVGGVNSGEFPEVDSSLTARVVLGALNWTVEWYHPGGKYSEEQVTAAMVNLLAQRALAGTDNRRKR